MKISEHADRTEKLAGIRAEDIHKWIDGFFDVESFEHFLRAGKTPNYDPYAHRKYRHCREALEDVYQEFADKYSREQIKTVFECHIRDDYDGYLPYREDFENGTFTEKYHENEDRIKNETILSPTELAKYFKGETYSRKKTTARIPKRFLLRIVLPTIIAIILFVSSIFVIIVPVFRDNLLTGKKEMIRELTATAASTIDYYIGLEQSGILSRAEAQERAIAEIKELRYGEENKDYFWITDMHPTMVMHPYREDLSGADLSDYVDSEDRSGKKLFVEFVSLVEAQNEGYLEYLWQWKDDPSQTVPKLSYIRGIPAWNWIIGTGIYIHDVEQEINHLTTNLLIVFTTITVGLVIILSNIVLQSYRIENNRLQAETGLLEAKDRYRALVEASNEGYILEVGGEIIYFNHTLKRMLGYSEDELVSMKVYDLLVPDFELNAPGITYLKELFQGKATGTEFEARVKTKSGETLDVLITTSRIFFSLENGHIISFRPLTRHQFDSAFDFFKGAKRRVKSRFIFKQVGEVCRPLHNSSSTTMLGDVSIKEDAPVFEALSTLETTDRSEILVMDQQNQAIGSIGYNDIARMYAGRPAEILSEIRKSKNDGHVIYTLKRLPGLIREMTDQGASPNALRRTIGRIFDAAIRQFIELSLKDLGPAPVSFAFLSLGSNGRHEMTLFSDQDNALVFADVEVSELETVQAYFAGLAFDVSSKLNQAGYPYCPGGIMASNPQWCMPISAWKKKFAGWIRNPTPEALLEINVFLDIHCVYGDHALADVLKRYALEEAAQNPQFFIHFAKNSLLYKAPLNFLGHIRAEKRDGLKIVNIKESLKPIEILARIYAFKHQIVHTNTTERLKQLMTQGVLHEQTYREMMYVFDYLWDLRFYNQIITHADLDRINDELDLDKLTDIEHHNLRNVLSKITTFQTNLSYDFLGSSGTLY